MDKFKFFSFANPLGIVTVEIPSQVTKPREVIASLRDAGLTVPWNADTFWVNSKRCHVTLNGRGIGDLLYAQV